MRKRTRVCYEVTSTVLQPVRHGDHIIIICSRPLFNVAIQTIYYKASSSHMIPFYQDHDDNPRFHTVLYISDAFRSVERHCRLSLGCHVPPYPKQQPTGRYTQVAVLVSKFRSARVPLQESIPPRRTGA
jgi:hypothetical protein